MSTGLAEILDLSPGSVLLMEGREWTVRSFEPQYGQVLLAGPDEQGERQTSLRSLLQHPDCRPGGSARSAVDAGRQPAGPADLTSAQHERLRVRVAHLLEVETGFRSGDPCRPGPGEPRAGYDPQATTLGQRRRAKVAELGELGRDEVELLGLAWISERTLERMAASYRRFGMIGCADGRWLRRSGGRPSVGEEVREAIFAVHAETLHRSRLGMKTRERLIHQYVAERFDGPVAVPCYNTLRAVWAEWFGPGGARQRYARSAAAVEASGRHIVVHRPGQVVALDTTPLPVKVREGVFGDPVSACLTMALDVYTRSVVGFRLTLVSDTSVDVAMLLRDVMMPLPLRPDWGEDLEWPYPGIPATLVAQFAGHRVAALPFFAPETVTTDHGSVYKNHHVVEIQRVLGCNILPARVLRPTDKQTVERVFGSLRSLLLEHLLGYSGVDTADRGVDPERDAVLTVDRMEHLIATWVVKIWQNRQLGEHAPSWDPGGTHSPNTLFAAAMQQGGFALQIPKPQLYYQLLPAHYVKIQGRRGVKLGKLWYDGPVLDPYRDGPSTRGGRHHGKWVVRRDKRDCRFAFFQDLDGTWHTLRWTGLPPEGEVPSFGEAQAQQALEEARRRGLAPRSDADLLPVLLELLGGASPVDSWPTQQPKGKRTEQSRQAAQAQAASRDRPTPPDVDAQVVQLASWRERADQAAQSLDAERRRRREAAVAAAPKPPPLLGEALRRQSLFLLPDEDDITAAGGPEQEQP